LIREFLQKIEGWSATVIRGPLSTQAFRSNGKINFQSPYGLVWIAASVLTTGCYDLDREIAKNQLEERADKQAFEMAGIGPDDLGLVEVHDCFTIAEFMRVEGLGLVPEGEYGKWMDEGWSEIGGKLTVNPSGGLLAKGHPMGATGVAQVAEVVWHLRNEAGERHVPKAKVGLTHCSGGGIASDTAACCVHILKI
jgi:acetyl-CoA acetyltransferase